MNTKNVILFFTLLIAVLSSCKDKITDVAYEDVKMLSFGFYAEDNAGVLFKDYVVINVNSSNIMINLPEGIDRSHLKSRFTTSEIDSITAGGVKQVSKVTTNDFTIPIDYIIAKGITHAKYTVTVGKASDHKWNKLPAFTTDSAVSTVMKVNPVNGLPYVLFKKSRSTSTDQKAAVIRFENGSWVTMGDASDGQIGSYFDLTFNGDGKPYVSYADYTASVAQMNTVKSFDGTAWNLVGNKGVTTNKVSYNTLAFSPVGKLMLFSSFDGTSGPLVRRELCISTFDNGTWTTNQTMPGRSSDQVAYLQVAKLVNGVLYLAILNAISPNSLSVYQYNGTTWTTLLDKWKDPASTAMTLRDFDMDADLAGNVYVAFADNSSDGATLKQRVIKYTKATASVSSVGAPIIGATGGLFNFDLALSPTGVPYLFYRNASNFPTITYFDNESQQWTTPESLETLAGTETVSEWYLDFAPNGDAYATYVKNRKLTAFRYSIP